MGPTNISTARTVRGRLYAWLLINLLAPNMLVSQVSVVTGNYDSSRTNSNLRETILNTSNVKPDSFGKVASFPVDGQIYAQPLYVSGVTFPKAGVRDAVYIATMHNSVYAIDAGSPASVNPLWQVNLGAPVPSSVLDFSDILPEVGILSTPVIDTDRQAIYVVSDTLENGEPVFRIHALSLADGHEMFNGPTVVAATVSGQGAGSSNGTLAFDASLQLQRPGLALTNGIVYAAFGSHADDGEYHGWIIGYDAGDLRHRAAVFNSTPDNVGGSFWQGGRAPAIDAAGNLVAVTANGDGSDSAAYTNSILKLSGKNLELLDWFTPDNSTDMDDDDMDLGSAGAVLISGGTQVLTGGKSGELVLTSGSQMGHGGPMNSKAVQSFPAVEGGSSEGMYNLALWQRQKDAMVYVQEACGPLKAFAISGGQLNSTLQSASNPATCTFFSGIAVSADGDRTGSAVVWQTTADYAARQIPGALHAFDATDLTHELWNSDMVPDRDALGRFAKFATPTVVNGRVWVPTFSNRVDVYGLLAGTSPSSTPAQVTVVANGASLLQGAVSPGEAVAIFGANLAPDGTSDLQVDETGHASSMLAGVQVTFDGIAAPLLHVAPEEIDAMVPFGTRGPMTQMRVVYENQTVILRLPVADAGPALFAADGTGGGEGAILNEDGTTNSGSNPAQRGSVVTLLATGLGPLTSNDDGRIADGSTVAAPVLPVSAWIDGLPAVVTSAGAAPGMVLGFVQITVRIPEGVKVYTSDVPADVPVVLKAGNYTSPGIVTVSVVP